MVPNLKSSLFSLLSSHHILSAEELDILLGMSMGLKPKSGDLIDLFRLVGLSHVLVLSGTNISLLGSIISKNLAFLQKKLRLFVSLLIPTVFVFGVAPQPSTFRALAMFALPQLAIFFGKRPHRLYLLTLTGLIFLLVEPQILFNISFQLSFAATFGIFFFVSQEDEESPCTSFGMRISHYFTQSFATTLAAQTFTIPLIFYHFNTVALLSPLANVLISWAVTPIMLLGLLAAVSAVLTPFLVPFTLLAVKPFVIVVHMVVIQLAQVSFATWSY